MQLALHQFLPNQGWEPPLDAAFDSPSTAVFVFAAPHVQGLENALGDLRQNFPQAHILGCSTAGEIYGQRLNDDTVTIAIARFENGRLASTCLTLGDNHDARATGQALAQALAAPDLRGLFVLADGLAVNGSELARGLAAALPKGLPVSGGLAADGDRFAKTWVISGGQRMNNSVTALGLYGEAIGIACNYRGGWDVFGPEREVTHAEGNVLYTLDDQPALALYRKYLGERADELPAAGLLFPLAIRNALETDGLTVRTILGIDEEKQSITFAGNIPQGAFVRMMRANRDRLIDGATEAAAGMTQTLDRANTKLCIAISCIGRRLVLGQRCDEEIEAVIDTLPAPCQLVGYYSYGELSPLGSGRCDLHNQTMTLTVFWENRA